MAFTRSFLKSLGLSEEQVQATMEAHLDVVTPLKEERDTLKTDADKLADLQKERDTLKAIVDKGDYEKEHQAFEAYKAQVEQQAQQAKVQAAYCRLLTEEKIGDKRHAAICKVTDFSGMKLDKDGNLQGADKLREAIRTDWAEFVTETHERGAKVETPPDTGKQARTKDEILAIKDTAERQRAIAENHTLFGF